MPDFIHVTTNTFFDRKGIIAATDRKTNKVLSSTGAFSRKSMQRGMRYRKKSSNPGDYPSAHKPTAYLRERILFGFDVESRSLIAGPDKLNRSDRDVLASGRTVPQLINEGGVVLRKQTYDKTTKKFRPIRRARRHTYRARPFVALTLPVAAKKLAENMEKIELK